mmetsp:Transcript_35123/g.107795  ORF Transcript_35123/g.107795 Transcript_35123/m.107795 type:complete len:143 (+) Transcript_35123:170-598(+)
MILLTRAASECEAPLSLDHWHDMVARYFALGIVLRRATANTDRDGDENLRMQGGRTLVPEITQSSELKEVGGVGIALRTRDLWGKRRQLAIIRRDERRNSDVDVIYEAKCHSEPASFRETSGFKRENVIGFGMRNPTRKTKQ